MDQHPAAAPVLDALFRSWERPQSAGFRALIASSMTAVSTSMSSDPLLGYTVDKPRLQAVLGRITRGLIYHETHTVLGSEVKVTVSLSGQLTPDQQEIATRLLSSSVTQYVGNVFEYRGVTVPEVPEASAWLFAFYGQSLHMAIALPTRLTSSSSGAA